MAENILNTNVSPVHWTTGSSTTAPHEDGRGGGKMKKPKPVRPTHGPEQGEEIATEGAELPHELDSFA